MSINIENSRIFTEADFDGSNAAPLLIVGPERRDSLIARQDALADNFAGVTRQRLEGLVDDKVVDFVADSIRNRMHSREGQNGAAYFKRLNVTPDFNAVEGFTEEEIIEACENAKIGQASLAQQAISAAAWGMHAWEGKNLTMVDTFRKELEEPMWQEVSDFSGVDARPSFAHMRGFRVHQFIGGETNSDPIRAMRIEMKRTINELDDGTELKARTYAIINTDASSGFEQRNLRSILRLVKNNGDQTSHYPLLEMCERLVDDTLPRGVVLARNETVYGYNAATEELFNERRAEQRRASDANW